MNKSSKLFGIVLILIIVGLLGFGTYLLFTKKDIINNFKKEFPALSEIGKVNLPGGLKGPTSPNKAGYLDPDKIIYWTNKYRTDNNLTTLTKNFLLVNASEVKAADIIENQYFEHNSPGGKTPAELVSESGYKYKVTGENLALGDFKDEKDLVDAWMNSPGHRANILNTDYTEIGVSAIEGSYQDRGITWVSVQEFGRPAPNCDKPDTELSLTIEENKATYEGKIQKVQELYDQANTSIATGNDIFKSTHDSSQAKIYWDEGEKLRTDAQAVQLEADILYNKIQTDTNEFNLEVNNYNICIQK